MSAFAAVGIAAAIAHYGALIALVEFAHWGAVPATLIGYVVGGLVSYRLNRAHVFDSDRSHLQAGWRFGMVAAVGFALTWGAMHFFVDRLGAPYLPAQFVTTLLVMGWSFLAHKFWTFGGDAPP